MAGNCLFLVLCIVVLAEVSCRQFFLHDKKSSACVGAKTLACTKHRLACPQSQQIKIKYAFYGFVRKTHGCSTNRTTCGSQFGCDCELSGGDCGLPYTRVDNAEVMRCSGQRSCNPSSSVSSDNSNCGRVWRRRKYNPKNSYTEIDYECIKAQRTETNIIKGQEIVLNASKDYAYTYTVSSRRQWVSFYQTNQKQKNFWLHNGRQTRAGAEYRFSGKFEFTIQPNTDTFVVLTGRGFLHQSDVTVSFKTDKQLTSTKPPLQRPHPTIKPTTPKHFRPISTSIRPKPEIRTTTKAFEMETKTTTTEAFVMEEVTRNIEDEIIKEENNDRMRPQASVAELTGSKGGLIGGVVGGIVALIIIILIVCLLICKRRRQTTAKPDVVDKGINNPGYEVSYINPKLQGPPPSYEEINPRNDNPHVLQGRPADDYDHLHDVINNQRNDVKDAEFRHLAGLNVTDFEKQDFDDLYDHLSSSNLQNVHKNL